MTTPIYQVDAFTRAAFAGNPAAVCFPERGASDAWLGRVAAEMNLSETAFLWNRDDGAYDLRWLTPEVEVDLCGHATLASAHTIWESGRAARDEPIRFATRSGELVARTRGELIELDFPATKPAPSQAPDELLAALGLGQAQAYQTRFDWMLVAESETQVRRLEPDHRALRAMPVRGVIVTAPGVGEHDFVSRFFAPGSGIDEDPVTGSAHCALGPYWSERLGKPILRAYQASARGGELEVEPRGDRVLLRGRAVTVLRGELLA
ncbi:MAG: PhzF family phenazine biosynthesis isomerase [Sandaracinaceae bacterium]|nr:PhzF family phenazine biosynthesis isomerase [Sandaracinaceae bacterium]